MSSSNSIEKAKILWYRFEKEGSEIENEHVMQECKQKLEAGGLVSFPTETVYGLGSDALNEQAVLSIFEAKKRPLTDPVIVHVHTLERAKDLLHFDHFKQGKESVETVFEIFGKTFWPGPLTIVSKSNERKVPMCVTAQTGYVGIRIPNHKLALKLLEYTQLCIAAPSANRFGHVSPTTAEHVYDDLKDQDIIILDTDLSKCKIGIESTVMKMDYLEQEDLIELSVLRRGGVSVEQIIHCMKKIREQHPKIKIILQVHLKKVSNQTQVSQVAPGQMITHYAPDLETFILSNDTTSAAATATSTSSSSSSTSQQQQQFKSDISQVVIIDFDKQLREYKEHCAKYLDLSEQGNILEASSKLFDYLRQSEKVTTAKYVLLPNMQPYLKHHDLSNGSSSSSSAATAAAEVENEFENADALYDRMFRAASGQFASINKNQLFLCHQVQPESH